MALVGGLSGGEERGVLRVRSNTSTCKDMRTIAL